MNDDKTASGSQKDDKSGTQATGADATAFAQIQAREEQEHARAEKEFAGFATELSSVEQTLQEQEEAAQQQERDQAKQDLMQFREKEVGTMVKKAQDEADKECDALDAAAKKKQGELVDNLVTQFTEIDFSKAA